MTTLAADEHSFAGQAVYTKAVLGIYDFWVHGISNHLIWRCPTRHLRTLYDRHVTSNHMDVGVGTGYFLDRCSFPSSRPRLILVDANRNSLEVAGRRLHRRLSGFPCKDRFHHAKVKRSSKRMASWAFAMHHSRGGIFHSFAARFNTRKRSLSALSSVGKCPLVLTARRSLAFKLSIEFVV